MYFEVYIFVEMYVIIIKESKVDIKVLPTTN